MHFVLIGLLAAKKKNLKILQIGANDGKVNDPIYEFVQRFLNQTEILLLEPQPNVAQQLAANYRSHPNAQVIVKAIGDGGTINLYSVKREVWGSLLVPYANGWPEGRAATGVVSSTYQHVADWLLKYGQFDQGAVDGAIECSSYETITVEEILQNNPGFRQLDVLQVDIEGSDHHAVSAVLDAGLRPLVINFESANLMPSDLEGCLTLLERAGYACFPSNMDTLCINLE